MLIPSFELGAIKIDYAKMRRKAERATDGATIKQLRFLRTRARTQVLRRRKRVSNPGDPPHVHSRDAYATLRNIRWTYEGKGVGVVGPVKLNQVNLTVKQGNQPVPNILEKGGIIKLHEMRYLVPAGGTVQVGQTNQRKRVDVPTWSPWKRRDLRFRGRPGEQRRVRPVRIAARPFMSEALKREIADGTIMDPWADVVTE